MYTYQISDTENGRLLVESEPLGDDEVIGRVVVSAEMANNMVARLNGKSADFGQVHMDDMGGDGAWALVTTAGEVLVVADDGESVWDMPDQDAHDANKARLYRVWLRLTHPKRFRPLTEEDVQTTIEDIHIEGLL